jgi:hypothetical protein
MRRAGVARARPVATSLGQHPAWAVARRRPASSWARVSVPCFATHPMSLMGDEAGGKEVETTGTMTKLNQLSARARPGAGQRTAAARRGHGHGGEPERRRRRRRRGQEARARGAGLEAAGQGERPRPRQSAVHSSPGEPVDASTGTWSSEAARPRAARGHPAPVEALVHLANVSRRGQLGRGGWSHSFEQWIEPDGDEPDLFSYRNHQGRDLYFPALAVGQELLLPRRPAHVHQRSAMAFASTSSTREVHLCCSEAAAPRALGTGSSPIDGHGTGSHGIRLAYQGERLAASPTRRGASCVCSRAPTGSSSALEVWAAPPEPEPARVGRPAAPGRRSSSSGSTTPTTRPKSWPR